MAEDQQQQHHPRLEASHLQSLFFRKDPCNQRKIFRELATSWTFGVKQGTIEERSNILVSKPNLIQPGL